MNIDHKEPSLASNLRIEQPEALHHTKHLTVVYRDIKPGDEARELIMHPKMTASSWSHVMDARDRLQDENANLNAGYAAARLEIESLQARIKTMAEEHADELMVAHLDGRAQAAQPAPQQEAVAWLNPWRADQVTTDYDAYGEHGIPLVYQQPAPAPQQASQQEPVAWYVTGCSRLLDEDEAKAEARHIGGTARAIPLYTAPQADSVQDLQPVHDAVTIDLLNERVAYLERKLKEADSVLEDAMRYRWLRDVGDPTWVPFRIRTGYSAAQVDDAIDAAMNKGGAA